MLNIALAFVLTQAKPSLLQQVRQTLMISGAPWKATEVTGSASHYEVKHDYSFVFYPDGRFVQSYKGPISQTYGNDGVQYWQIDRSRGVEKLDFEDRDGAMAIALVLSDNWLSPAAPVSITESGDTLHLRFKSSGLEELLKVDRATGYPTEASLEGSGGTMKIMLSDWRDAGDRKIPMHVELSEAGLTDTLTCDKVQSIDADPNLMKMPDWKPTDVSFDPAKPAAIEAKSAFTGHLLVHPLINGQDVGWFILDSGAEVMVIDKKTADDLKIESVGKEPMTGVGGNVFAAMRPVNEFKMGPVTVSNLLFSDYDLSEIGGFLGIKLAGIVGDDFFRRAVVSIDWKGPVIQVFSRDTYKLPEGNWLPIRFSSGNPAVEATVEGAPKSWFRFDTGANDFLTLHTPFVNKWNLLKDRKTTPSASTGAGGTVTAKAGKVKWFELGGHKFENPTVQFSTSNKGAFAEPYLAGNIGQLAMKPFRVVLDFSGYRLALVPK